MYANAYFIAAKGLMIELRDSGLVDKDTFEMICYRNAESLLGVHAPPRAPSQK